MQHQRERRRITITEAMQRQRERRQTIKLVDESAYRYIYEVLQYNLLLGNGMRIILCESYRAAVGYIAETEQWDLAVVATICYVNHVNHRLGQRQLNGGPNLRNNQYQRNYALRFGLGVLANLLNDVLLQLRIALPDAYNTVMSKIEHNDNILYEHLTNSNIRKLRPRVNSADYQVVPPLVPNQNEIEQP